MSPFVLLGALLGISSAALFGWFVFPFICDLATTRPDKCILKRWCHDYFVLQCMVLRLECRIALFKLRNFLFVARCELRFFLLDVKYLALKLENLALRFYLKLVGHLMRPFGWRVVMPNK